MGRNWEEGELFVWGDDGLVPADSQPKPTKRDVASALANNAFVQSSIPEENPESIIRRCGRESGRGEIVTDVDAVSGIMRTAPKNLPRRQRNTYASDEDYCNDPEELERRKAQRKSIRAKKERPSLLVRLPDVSTRGEIWRLSFVALFRKTRIPTKLPACLIAWRLSVIYLMPALQKVEPVRKLRSWEMLEFDASFANPAWQVSMLMRRWRK